MQTLSLMGPSLTCPVVRLPGAGKQCWQVKGKPMDEESDLIPQNCFLNWKSKEFYIFFPFAIHQRQVGLFYVEGHRGDFTVLERKDSDQQNQHIHHSN